MLKNKNKSACKLCELDEITKERIKDRKCLLYMMHVSNNDAFLRRQ
jgi:hypothetical protein